MARYALVIGITQNQAPLQTLEKSAADARAIADILRDFGDFQVEVLVKPEETTYKALEAKLLEFFNDRALRQEASIYYTGHGFQLKGTFGKKEAFLAPSDCVVELDADGQVVKQQNGLSLTAVNALAAEAELSNLVMLLDCCHSGYLLEESLLKQTFITFIQKDYWLMTACRSFQSAYAKKKEPYSIFTGAVLAGLKCDRANERGEITAGALFNYVAEALRGERQEVMQLSVGRPILMVRYPLAEPKPAVTIAETNPYQSLFAFTPATAKFFFGREPEIQKLVQQVQDCNFVPVIGASGSGKSSLVRAGLIPQLLELGWQVETMKPGDNPLATLKLTIGKLFATTEWEEIYRVVETEGLGSIASRLPGTDRVLLVVDQFEEVFVLSHDRQQQQEFIKCLTSVKQSENHRLVVVTTMRADFVEPWLTSGVLTQAIQDDALFLGVLAGEYLEDAISKPSAIQGYSLQPGLLELIVRDVADEENCLPLLEFALTELWEKRDRVKHELTVDEYKALGGLVGALDRHAEAIYQGLAAQGLGEWVQRVMLRLVRTGEGMRDTRHRRAKKDLLEMGVDAATQEKIAKTINGLVDGRLLAIDRVNAMNLVDLSHEAMMKGWRQFVKWRESDREARRLVAKIEEARREWKTQKSKKDKNYYSLQGPMLKKAKGLLKDRPELLVGEVRAFVLESLKYRRRSGSEWIAMVVIPLFIAVAFSESFVRDEVVKQDHRSIENTQGTMEERLAVLNIVGGCHAEKQYSWMSRYFRERLFGNCRSLNSAKLNGAQLNTENLSAAPLYNANLRNAQLNSVILIGTHLDNADLSNADLYSSNLSDTHLNNTNLSGAFLYRANLSGAQLTNTNLNGAHFDNAILENVTFRCFGNNRCPSMKNIRWNKDTNWKGIKGWENVKNIPPELKKQLNLHNN
jgi:Caspase domain/Pentapeptide repeats (8 copies)